ncbi:MAG: hypothetical protein SZ59_C0002G0231 [candidate division TM6 bacterium GW2011_GWF2_28_16]|nr:MAG: hypothetical protein SZ59_C0002G0231 [candidate division TM6 bacterium GW2011_GWF2_28_16]
MQFINSYPKNIILILFFITATTCIFSWSNNNIEEYYPNPNFQPHYPKEGFQGPGTGKRPQQPDNRPDFPKERPQRPDERPYYPDGRRPQQPGNQPSYPLVYLQNSYL